MLKSSLVQTVLLIVFAAGVLIVKPVSAYIGQCQTACKARPLNGFISRVAATSTKPAYLMEDAVNPGDSSEFRFVGVNTPNLARIELGNANKISSNTAIPSDTEIWDLLCGVQQVGARVARNYVLSYCDDGTCHISLNRDGSEVPSLSFNETWFLALDTAIATANTLGIRLILPLINMIDNPGWGGAASLSRWANVPPTKFFTNNSTRKLYKSVATYVLNRNNTITGIPYNKEPAIFGWELGNELFQPQCEDLSPPHCGSAESLRNYPGVPIGVNPKEMMMINLTLFTPFKSDWTQEMAAFLRFLDPLHMVISGGYIKQDIQLLASAVDLVGGTYYSEDTTELLSDIDTVGGMIPIIVKEFGLAGNSNATVVREIASVLNSSAAVAGGLYWSFRGHSLHGGFYWHYEAMMNVATKQNEFPQSLHFPGFSNEAPTYEKDMIQVLKTANSEWIGLAALIYNESDFTPCQPTVKVFDDASFPPCFSFIGATGAERYEVWTRPAGQDEWFRAAADAHDAVVEQKGFITFVDSDSIRSLLGYAGSDQPWEFSFQSCTNSSCSEGTDTITLFLNATNGVPSSMCNASYAIQIEPRTEDSLHLRFTLFSFTQFPELYLAVELAGIVVFSFIFISLFFVREFVFDTVSKGFRATFKYVKEGNVSVGFGGYKGHETILEVTAVMPQKLVALQVLKVVGTVLILLFARRAKLAEIGFDSDGASAGFSLFFTVTGFEYFVLRSSNVEQSTSISAYGLALRQVARIWPSVFLSSVVGMIVSPGRLYGEHLLLPMQLSTWMPSMRQNEINSLVWMSGALVFNSLLFLPVYDAMKKTSPLAQTRLYLLAFCWVVTAWQALDFVGMRLFLLDRFIAAIFLRTYTGSFVAGVLLASLHDEFADKLIKYRHWHFAVGSLVIPAVLYVHRFIPSTGWSGIYLRGWVQAGLYLPLFCIIIFGATVGKSCGRLASLLSNALVPLSRLAWLCPTLLFFEQPMWNVAIIATGSDDDRYLWIVYAIFTLLAALVSDVASRPLQRLLLGMLPSDARLEEAQEPSGCEYNTQPSSFNLLMYYGSFVVIVFTFCIAQLFDPWVTAVDVTQYQTLATFLSYFSWILLLPAPCLLQCLLGFMFYPAITEASRKGIPIAAQLHREEEDRPQLLSTRPPFVIHFRIVTRGNNPNLVLSNCQDALRVLRSSGLPESRWKVDIATDNHMDTIDQVPEVEEIVVPTSYQPPGGCKYKARALNYAANASSALDTDWIVHLDEETRFDVDTVEHIFAHCVKQEHAVARHETKYPSVGQGVIYYNTATIDNYLTTLADYIRVSDDYAKFQLQYKLFRLPLVGMHGSFVVIQTSLERDVGWDWGMVGSITEDTYLAMYLAALGVRFDWCGGKMYEQSPFTCLDFAKQRARWFSGLWLCVLTDTLPLWQRTFLGHHLISWSLCPILTLITWVNLVVLFPRSYAFIYIMSFIYAIPFFSYAIGFLLGASPAQFKHGRTEYCLLFLAHICLIPIYTIMETWGVARGILDRKTYTGFHIVQKERAPAASDAICDEILENREKSEIVTTKSRAEVIEASSDNDILKAEVVPRPPGPSDTCDLSDEVLRSELEYWAQILNIEFHTLDLVLQDRTKLLSSGTMQTLETTSVGQGCALTELSQAAGANELVVVVSLVGCLMNQGYLPGGDLLIGVVTGNAGHAECTLQVMPISVPLRAGQTFGQLLSDVAAAMQAGIKKTFSVTVGDLTKAVDRSTLFHALVKMDSKSDFHDGAWPTNLVDDMPILANLYFSWAVDCEGALLLSCSYDAGQLEAASVRRLQDHLSILSSNALDQPDVQGLSREAVDIQMMTSLELDSVTRIWPESTNNDCTTHPATLQQLLQLSLITGASDKIAVESPAQGLKWTYSQVNTATLCLAGRLKSDYGIAPGSVVAVAAERTVECVIALLSITRAGASYMPIDMQYPAARIQHMLKETQASALVCHIKSGAEWQKISTCPVVTVDSVELCSNQGGADHVFKVAVPSDRAAVLYTSGSTGLPKGVEISQGALARQQSVMGINRGMKASDRVVHQTILTFDVAGNEIWGAIKARASLVIVDDDTRLLGLGTFILKNKITVLFITPSHLGLMDPSACSQTLRMLVLAGEVLPQVLVDKWATPKRTMYNEYGPTETNVVTTRICTANMINPSSIGRSLPGVKILIFNTQLRPTAVGVAGELCVAGQQLANGYLCSPDLTASKFIEYSGQRLYRTGDLCRWLPDGTIDFCGRLDHQVKIRGMRVEVGEIESAILSLPFVKVKQCAVLLLGQEEKAARLVAFLVLDPIAMSTWSEDKALHMLQATLPQHMVPTVFELLDELPTTSSGKINRKVLMEWTSVGARKQTGFESDDFKGPFQKVQAGSQVAVAISEDSPVDNLVTGIMDGFRLKASTAGEDIGNMGKFLQSNEVKALQRLGVDSLGIARHYYSMVRDIKFAIWELQVADGVRAICMYGVMIDHLASCMPNGVCQGFLRGIAIPNSRVDPVANKGFIVAEIFVRSIGNYKTIAGFVMTTAYMDSGTGSGALRFSASDVIIFLIFLEMAWIFDPIATAAVGSAGLDTSQPWWLSNQRWYLLAMLLCRLAVVVLHAFHVPPFAQVILAACGVFLLPSNIICMSNACANMGIGYLDLNVLPAGIRSIITFLFVGTEPQESTFEFTGFAYAVTRKYLLCVLLYLLIFHYGRSVVRLATKVEVHKKFFEAVDYLTVLPASIRSRLPGLIYGLMSGLCLLALCLYQALSWSAMEDTWLMGTISDDGTEIAHEYFANVSALIVVLVIEICLMSCMVSALPNVLGLVGSTTLGSYVAHGYVNLFVTIVIFDRYALSPGTYITIILAVPAFTQIIVGPLVQKALIIHLQLAMKFTRSAYNACFGTELKVPERREDLARSGSWDAESITQRLRPKPSWDLSPKLVFRT